MSEIKDDDIKEPPRRRGPGMGPGKFAGGEKADDFGSAIKKLATYASAFIAAFVVAMVLAVAGAILNLVGPGKLSDITNLIGQGLTSEIDVDAVVQIAVLLAILYAIAWFCNFFQSFIMATITQKITRRLRSDISQKIDRLPLSYFDNTSIGNVMSRISNDVDMIGQTLNQSIGTLVSAIAMFFGSLFCMFYTNWIMAISGVLASVLGFAIMMAIVKMSQKYFNAQQQTLGVLNGQIEETYSGHAVVKAYNAQDSVKEKFTKTNNKLYECAWKSQFLSGLMQPLMGFVGNLGYVVVCIVGALLTMQNIISFGVIVAFMIYVRQFTQPLSQFAQAANSLQSAAAAAERVFEILEEEEMEPDADISERKLVPDINEPNNNSQGDVVFSHVKFGYSADKIIIDDFSMHAKPGQKIAIVGPTGAGKTTIVNLLMRFYEIQGGEILIDGVNTKNMTREEVHDNFCMVLQDTWLIAGSVRDNVVYSKENAIDEEVEDACKAVGLHHFIKTLPQGYDTPLTDETSLSAGQKQLVTIARAMIKNSPMLILDEATSNVDTRTEELISKSMDKLMTGRTSFVIAHRLSTIKNADLILVLNEGKIIEQGTHSELLTKNGFYANLYNSQFEDFN